MSLPAVYSTRYATVSRPPAPAPASAPAATTIVTDALTGTCYLKGQFLGKGGFAKVYEMKDLATGVVYAGKVVAKSSISKERAKQKLLSEIKLHRSLTHKHVVGFERFFEDKENVYIVLEMCENKSFMELMKVRRRLTEAEVAYYVQQLIDATEYMHERNIIHRDLKLGNLFLNSDLEVKVGDFGLATSVEHTGQRKKTICGTPNYIAPEILDSNGRGHSFEVDIWSIGVIIYTLLIGKPPFETTDVKTTYKRIKANMYSFPERYPVSEAAHALIRSCLQGNPDARPSLAEIKGHRFFTQNKIPKRLPRSALHSPPSRSELFPEDSTAPAAAERLPLGEKNARVSEPTSPRSRKPSKGGEKDKDEKKEKEKEPLADPAKTGLATARPSEGARAKESKTGARSSASSEESDGEGDDENRKPENRARKTVHADDLDEDDRTTLNMMHRQLTRSFAVMNTVMKARTDGDAATKPLPNSGREPPAWVIKWVDYSNKYGLGYQLSNDVIGVFFNDATKIALSPNNTDVEYVERLHGRDGWYDERARHSTADFPETLQKKMTLLNYFEKYLVEHLEPANEPEAAEIEAAAADKQKKPAPVGPMTYVKKWLRTKHAIIFRLSDKTVQVNFFDHTKIILHCEALYVTYIDKQRVTSHNTLAAIMAQPSPELVNRLKYVKDILHHLLSKNSSAPAPASPTPA